VRTQTEPAQRVEAQQESEEDTNFEALMARLDELEAAERAGNQETWAAAGESDESQGRGLAKGSQGEGEPAAESQPESSMGMSGQKRVCFVQEEPGGAPGREQGQAKRRGKESRW
jgi:hypothetical protein